MKPSRKRKLFIHVGQAKAGSTTIQVLLHRLSASLEQFGVHVVATSALLGNHGRLAMPGARENPALFPDLDAVWAALFEEVTGCGASRYVVSAEQFSNPRGRMTAVGRFQGLAEAANLEVEVIACVRPQWQWLEASWAQRVWGGTVSPPFTDCWEAGLDDERLDYNRVFAPWKQAFGRVTVIPLQRARLPEGLLARFLDILEVDDARTRRAASRLPRHNRRPGGKSVEVRRLTGLALRRHGLLAWQRARCLETLEPLRRVFDGDPPFAGLSPAQIGTVVQRFASRNARFAREFGVDAGGELFADEPVDGFDRPVRPTWRDLGDDERSKVIHFVRSRLGIKLPQGIEAPRGTARRSVPARLPAIAASLSGPRARGIGYWSRALWAGGWLILRGLAQTRWSGRGLLIGRWLHWQSKRLMQLARGGDGR